jgi:putative transferase (TIGR04331 family)
MLFLKNASNGLKKKNIILVNNFSDPTTKKNLTDKGYIYEEFKLHDTSEKLIIGFHEAKNVYNKFIKKIKAELEKVSKKKIDIKIIHLIFSKWLFYYISNNYYKYQILLKIKKKYPNCALVDIKDKKINEDDKLFTNSHTTILNFNLLKNIGKYMGIKIVETKLSQIQKFIFFIPSAANKRNRFSINIYIKYFISRISIIISKLFYRDIVFMHEDVLNFSNIIKIIFKSKFKFAYLSFQENHNLEPKSYPQFSQLEIKSTNHFEKILLKNFSNYIPVSILSLIDYIQSENENKNENKKNIRKKNIIISKRFFGAEFINFKKYIIKNFYKNTLVSYQHGGLYGQEVNYFPEIAERLISHYFASWGWKGKNIFTLPLEKKNNNEKQVTGGYCLVVANSSGNHFLSLGNNPESILNHQMKQTRELLIEILKKKSLILRLPNYGHYWREHAYFSKINQLKIDNHKKNFVQMALGSDYVIHNHFNTTSFETLSLNIPTLIYSPKIICKFNSEATRYLKKLIKVNIFFYSHSDLVKFLKKNNFDLKSWWNQEKVQEVRRDFLKNYCNSLHDWPNEWMTKLSIINKQI